VTAGRSWPARGLADFSYASCMRSCDSSIFCEAYSLDTTTGVCLQYAVPIASWQSSANVMSGLSGTTYRSIGGMSDNT